MKPLIFALFALFLTAAPLAQAADFHGYPCTQDCAGHKAGYTWAQDKGVDDAAACGGNSQSFTEGCHAYVSEHFDPDAIAPAAGGDNPADPNVTADPFIDDPFYKDPFDPEALPVPGSNPFGN